MTNRTFRSNSADDRKVKFQPFGSQEGGDISVYATFGICGDRNLNRIRAYTLVLYVRQATSIPILIFSAATVIRSRW